MDNFTDTWWVSMTEDTSNFTETPDGHANGPMFPKDLLNQYGIYVAGMNLLAYQTLIWCAIGIPSNLASIATLMKIQPVTSSTILLTLLAVVDIIVLCYNQLFTILIVNLKYRVSEIGCKIYFYIGSILVQYSIWLMVAITVERFIAVWFPLKVTSLITIKRTKITVTCMLIFLALCNIPYAVSTSERQELSGITANSSALYSSYPDGDKNKN